MRKIIFEAYDWVMTKDEKILFEIEHVGEDYVRDSKGNEYLFFEVRECYSPFSCNNIIRK